MIKTVTVLIEYLFQGTGREELFRPYPISDYSRYVWVLITL